MRQIKNVLWKYKARLERDFKKAQTNKRAGRYMLPSNTIRIAEAI